MKEFSIFEVDLAKKVFQLHGSAADGLVVFRKKLSRLQFERFMIVQLACTVAMEACGMDSCSSWRHSSSGSSVSRRKATTVASSASARIVERGSFGPVLRSSTV